MSIPISEGSSPRVGVLPRVTAALLIFIVLYAAACGTTDDRVGDLGTPSRSAALTPRPRVSVAFDLGGIMRQVHFAFRPDGGSWSGGHTNYEIRATASDFAVTPARAEDGAGTRGAPVRFATVRVGRAGAPGGAGSEPRVDLDGSLVIGRGEAAERLENREDGVAQSFEFERPPQGSGDLVVRIQVTGQEYAGKTAGGHHFVDPVTGLGVRYGLATWIDAEGDRVPVEVARVGGGLELTVPAAVLDGSSYPAVLDPIVGPEIAPDDPIPSLAQDNQLRPAVASDGTDFLVTWLDERAIDATYPRLYAARVSAAGALLDPGGIIVTTDVQASAKPAVAYGGGQYLIAWEADNGEYLRAARVSAAGAVLDAPAITVAFEPMGNPTSPAIAFDGAGYLVVWTLNLTMIRGARVGLLGTIETIQKTIISAPQTQANPAVAFDGVNYLVTWEDLRSGMTYDIYAARVTTSVDSLDGLGFLVSAETNDQRDPAVASDGSGFFIAWSDGKWGALIPDIYGARVTSAGAVLDPSGIAIAMTAGAQLTPSAVFHEGSYTVAWMGNDSIHAARVDAAGAVLDMAGVPVSTGPMVEDTPAIACSSAACLVAWSDMRSGARDIYGARLAAGVVLDPAGIPISGAANREQTPDVAWDGSNYLAVWQDRRAGHWDIYGARISAQGAALDPAGIAIATGPFDQQTPALAWGGSGYLVVWQDQAFRIQGAVVDSAGSVLGPFVQISTPDSTQVTPDVGFDGTNHLVAWTTAFPTTSITGARVSPTGTVLAGSPFSVAGGFGTKTNPTVAFGGGVSLVVWEAAGELRSVRVTPAGAKLDLAPGFLVALGTQPAVAFDGISFVVANTQSNNLYARRVSPAGDVLDPGGQAISVAATTQDQAAVGCDLSACLIVYRTTEGGADAQLKGSRFTQLGAVLDPGGFLIASGAAHGFPALATDGAGQFLLAYNRSDTTQPFGAVRVRARLITSLPVAATCDGDGACDSGYCVDGVCCSTSCGGGSPTDCQACSVAAGAPADGTCAPLTGTTCSDADACTQVDTCQAGTCMGASPIGCNAQDECHLAGACDPATGLCSNPAQPNGTGCDDASACTQNDACQAGVCTGAPIVCPVPNDCHMAGACDPATGQCVITEKADGAACNDGDLCTENDMCQAAACVSGTPKACPDAPDCKSVAACDPATGQCAMSNQPNGTDCGELCEIGGACQNGSCVGAMEKGCEPVDDCHIGGECNPNTGMCSNPPKGDSSTCPGGHCFGGVCVPDADGGTSTGTGTGGAGTGGAGAGGSDATGSTGAGNTDDPNPSTDDEGGCGCRVPASRESSPVNGVGSLVLALALLRLRRRRAPIQQMRG